MVARCNTRNGQIRPITRGESSSIKTVVFPDENATIIDSVGYYHNLIINDVRSNGKSYTDDKGNIDFSAYYEDVFVSAKNTVSKMITRLILNFYFNIWNLLSNLWHS